MSKNNKFLIAGAGVAVVAILGAGFYFMKDKEPPNDNPLSKHVVASHIVGYSNNGMVSLYESENGKELTRFDLKTLSDKKEVQVEEVIEVPDKKPVVPEKTPEPVKQPEVETYKDFEKVEVVIKKGEYAWKIQKELTPKRDVGQMLELVSDANGGKVLHPIFPGEKIFFLKEKGNGVSTPPKAEEPITEPVKEPVKETPKTVTTTKKIEDATYIFYNDVEHRAVYAYSDFDDEVYKISENEGKLDVQEIAHNDKLSEAKDMMISNDKAFLSLKDQAKIQIIDLKNPSDVKEIELGGKVSNFVVKDNIVYYTYQDQMGKYNLETNEKLNVLVGDESLDLVSHQDKLYVLNAFGSKTENSLLMQINPSDLNVDNILELKSNTTAILSKGQEETLLIGATEKSKDLSGKEIVGNKVSAVKVKTLSLENSKWTIPFSNESMTYDSFLYVLNDQKLNVYSMNNVEPVKTIGVAGEGFAILP